VLRFRGHCRSRAAQPRIRPATRERILASAREHGSKPNIVARNLKTRRTWEVGLVVHDLENEFFTELVNAIQEIAWEKGYYIQIAVSRRQPERERTALEHMAGRNVDGILLFPTSADPGFEEFLRGLGRRIVTIANRVSPAWPFVGLSDRSIIREATREIISRGYARLVFVGPFDALIMTDIRRRRGPFHRAGTKDPLGRIAVGQRCRRQRVGATPSDPKGSWTG
jgi:LacI family transcriptional regulator